MNIQSATCLLRVGAAVLFATVLALSAGDIATTLDPAKAGKVFDGNGTAIDRYSVVTRHNIEWNELHGQMPLGNGEFCFNADATGLQTFGGNTLSHWGWHSSPLPSGCTPADLPTTGTIEQGRITGPMRKAAERGSLMAGCSKIRIP